MTTILTHPVATPPTRAPSAPLPVTALPNGSMNDATAPAAAVEGPSTTGVGMSDPFSSVGNSTILYALIGIGLFVLVGMFWSLSHRREAPPVVETPFSQ